MKKAIKIILVIILVLLIYKIGTMVYKANIFIKHSNAFNEFRNYDNLKYTYKEANGTINVIYFKNEVSKCVSYPCTGKEEDASELFYYINGERIGIDKVNKTFHVLNLFHANESENSKALIINYFGIDFNNFMDNFSLESISELWKMLNCEIVSEKFNNVECYKCTMQPFDGYKQILYIDKETYLPICTYNYIRENGKFYEDMKFEYSYEKDVVTDEDVEIMDLSEFTQILTT